jgi:hypothetical protein
MKKKVSLYIYAKDFFIKFGFDYQNTYTNQFHFPLAKLAIAKNPVFFKGKTLYTTPRGTRST